MYGAREQFLGKEKERALWGDFGVLLATAPPRRELKKFSSERVTLCLAPPKIGGFETCNG